MDIRVQGCVLAKGSRVEGSSADSLRGLVNGEALLRAGILSGSLIASPDVLPLRRPFVLGLKGPIVLGLKGPMGS